MADVLIAILKFPNDPTNNRTAHQMFLTTQIETSMDLYSVSSIFDKEKEYTTLAQHSLFVKLHRKIIDKISKKKAEEKHTVYSIYEAEFVLWNPKVKKI